MELSAADGGGGSMALLVGLGAVLAIVAVVALIGRVAAVNKQRKPTPVRRTVVRRALADGGGGNPGSIGYGLGPGESLDYANPGAPDEAVLEGTPGYAVSIDVPGSHSDGPEIDFPGSSNGDGDGHGDADDGD